MKKFKGKGYKGRKGLMSKVSKMINKRIAHNTELKYYPTSNTGTADVDGTFIDLCTPAQGNTDVTRNGDKITAKSLQLHMAISGADTTNIFRLVIFRWKQNTVSIAPTAAYLFSPYNNATNTCIAPFAHDTRGNFQILYDKIFRLNTANSPPIVIKKRFSLKKLPQIAFDAGGTNGNNHIYMFVVSDSSIANHPGYGYISRVNYVDS